MRKRIITALIVAAFLSLSLQSVVPQRKPGLGPERVRAPDEMLFTQADYDNLIGWRLIAQSHTDVDGVYSKYFYDPERVTDQSRSQKVVKQAWIKDQEWKTNNLLSYSMNLFEYDCGARKFRISEIHNYNRRGILTTSTNEPTEWLAIIPESVTDIEFGVLCLNQRDMEQKEMDIAGILFMSGRQEEKERDLAAAINHYQAALEHAPRNQRILAAIDRVRRTQGLRRRH